MLEHSTTLPLRSAAILSATATGSQLHDGVELALFRAREVLEAGWQLTPDEAIAMVGSTASRESSPTGRWSGAGVEAEDELDDIPLFFGEN